MAGLFLFLDESGDFVFNVRASRYLVFTCLSTVKPAAISGAFAELRYELFGSGIHLERFHAAEDKQAVRDKVFEILSACADFVIDAEIVEKWKTYPPLQSYRLYSRIYEILLSYVLRRQDFSQIDSVHIICDTIPLRRKREAMEGALKMSVAHILKRAGRTGYVVFHASASEAFLQAADYCSWAIFRRWEKNDPRSYDLIRNKIKSEFDVFRFGTCQYS